MEDVPRLFVLSYSVDNSRISSDCTEDDCLFVIGEIEIEKAAAPVMLQDKQTICDV